MTWAQTITALSAALGCADDADAVAAALRERAKTERAAGAGAAVVARIQNLESSILKRAGAEAQAIYHAPDVLELLA